MDLEALYVLSKQLVEFCQSLKNNPIEVSLVEIKLPFKMSKRINEIYIDEFSKIISFKNHCILVIQF